MLGSLLILEATLMCVPLALSVYTESDDFFAFIVSLFLVIMAAVIFLYAGKNNKEMMSRREASLLVSITWIIYSLFGSLPFLVNGYIPNFTDAYFETMSGFTTTGATIMDDVDHCPQGLLLWRSMTQWIGGLGIAFFTIAVLPGLVGGSVSVFSAEATGPLRNKMHPKLSTNAKIIASVYLTLTASCALLYSFGGMTTFDAINYAMSTTATGGFSTHTDSTHYFGAAFIDFTAIIFMFLSGINFTMLYLIVAKGKVRKLIDNTESYLYISLILISTLIITILLVLSEHTNYDILHAIRVALFQVVSLITTTGVFNEATELWPHVTWVILAILMFIGGCAGSTAGGFKCVRASMVIKLASNELRKNLHPKAVLPLRINSVSVNTSQQVSLLVFLAVYILLCLVTYIILAFSDEWLDPYDAITIAISSASNVGPALGAPLQGTCSWSGLSATAKWSLSFLMLMGRLEILSVLVLFTPSFWKDS